MNDPWTNLKAFTAARIALGRTGVSEPLQAMLQFRLAHAHARDAVNAIMDKEKLLPGIQSLKLTAFLLDTQAVSRSHGVFVLVASARRDGGERDGHEQGC